VPDWERAHALRLLICREHWHVLAACMWLEKGFADTSRAADIRPITESKAEPRASEATAMRSVACPRSATTTTGRHRAGENNDVVSTPSEQGTAPPRCLDITPWTQFNTAIMDLTWRTPAWDATGKQTKTPAFHYHADRRAFTLHISQAEDTGRTAFTPEKHWRPIQTEEEWDDYLDEVRFVHKTVFPHMRLDQLLTDRPHSRSRNRPRHYHRWRP